MKINFDHPIPRPTSLAEAQAMIEALWPLGKLVEALQSANAGLEKRVAELEARLNQNSSNSSKPPSSDGLNKPQPKSRREKNGRRPGGQKGHKGYTLEQSQTPSKIIDYYPGKCCQCGVTTNDKEMVLLSRRQVFDIPPQTIEVTEHRIYSTSCGCCGQETRSQFPAEVTQTVQYGKRIKSLLIYLSQYQLLPYARIREFVEEVFSHKMSVGTLVNINKKGFTQLAMAEKHIKALLQTEPLLHADETGVRVQKELYWLHVNSTEKLTYYGVHAKRGSEAMNALELLPTFKGILVHDHLKSYFKYGNFHALCNAHHLRELTFVKEQYQREWASKLEKHLLMIKRTVEAHYKEHGVRLGDKQLKQFQRRYINILQAGKNESIYIIEQGEKRAKKPKDRNLLERLQHYHQSVLAFMYNPQIPFDNNQAERDIRMTKVQQKISGCFRSFHGAEIFCRIRGYISTAKKNNVPLLQALHLALSDSPFLPNA